MTHNLLLTSQISIMAKIEFKMKLPATSKKLYDLCTDFENHKKAFPSQLKNIEIIEEDEFKITTKEILVFNTYFKNTEIHQPTTHEKKFPMIKSKIIDGPFKGSVIQVVFNELDEGTIVSCEFELKIALKYKILTNIIKTKYKVILTSLLYKMNNLAMNEQVKN